MSGAWSSVVPSPETGLPEPRPTEVSQPHWDGAARGRLMVQHCPDCSNYTFPPQLACTTCLSERLEWVESSGRGTVYSATVVHRPQRPEFAAPYAVMIVELDEGWFMLANLREAEADSVRIGMRVEVVYERRGAVVLPQFRLATHPDLA